MLDPQLQQRFLQLPPSLQGLVTGDFAEDASDLFGHSLQLTEEETDVFENGITLLLLYIFNKQDLKEYLAAHTNASHFEIHNVVEALIKSLPDDFHNTQTSPVAPSMRPLAAVPISHTLDKEILETEHSFENTPGLRTMAGDASHLQPAPGPAAQPYTPPPYTPPAPAPTYQSSQADILSRAAPPPPPPVQESPRWESD